MDEGLNGKIDARLTEVKTAYEKLEKERIPLVENRNTLVSQVSAIDRRVNEINTAIFGLNERFNELVGFLPKAEQAKWVQLPPEEKKVTETIPKQKKKKK